MVDKLRPKFGKAAALMGAANLTYGPGLPGAAPGEDSTSTLERLNKENKRRANVVGIFPNEASIRRLIGAVLME